MLLAVMDKGPGLLHYYEYNIETLQIEPTRLLEAVDSYVDSVSDRMVLVCGEMKSYDEAELIMYDYKSKKLRVYTVALREERL